MNDVEIRQDHNRIVNLHPHMVAVFMSAIDWARATDDSTLAYHLAQAIDMLDEMGIDVHPYAIGLLNVLRGDAVITLLEED